MLHYIGMFAYYNIASFFLNIMLFSVVDKMEGAFASHTPKEMKFATTWPIIASMVRVFIIIMSMRVFFGIKRIGLVMLCILFAFDVAMSIFKALRCEDIGRRDHQTYFTLQVFGTVVMFVVFAFKMHT